MNDNGIVCKAYFVTDCCILAIVDLIIFNRLKVSLVACWNWQERRSVISFSHNSVGCNTCLLYPTLTDVPHYISARKCSHSTEIH